MRTLLLREKSLFFLFRPTLTLVNWNNITVSFSSLWCVCTGDAEYCNNNNKTKNNKKGNNGEWTTEGYSAEKNIYFLHTHNMICIYLREWTMSGGMCDVCLFHIPYSILWEQTNTSIQQRVPYKRQLFGLCVSGCCLHTDLYVPTSVRWSQNHHELSMSWRRYCDDGDDDDAVIIYMSLHSLHFYSFMEVNGVSSLLSLLQPCTTDRSLHKEKCEPLKNKRKASG